MKFIVLVYIYFYLKHFDCNDKTLLSKIEDIKVLRDYMSSVIIDVIDEPTGKRKVKVCLNHQMKLINNF